ncbi:site-specific DNA-methyltransferase [Streptosporangium sp. NPDC023963]|uniref:DNA-methyltransferase n=1 Tax=Streptosporangium sp. NPDC023963 TaxID=3155608 RepID=UPI00344636C7
MTALIVRGDARQLPLPDASVDLIVTSPPYFGLRSYQDGGEHYAGQIGDELTPREYIDNLLDCTREWMRVLKPEGSLWLNLGDKYAQNPGQFGPQGASGQRANRAQAASYVDAPARQTIEYGVRAKSLTGLPWRYALGCIDDLGLILRAEVIWSKTNGLPESVTDRVRRSHEQWFHFTKEPRYFSAVDEIRQPHADTSAHAMSRRQRTDKRLIAANAGMSSTANPLGALPGSVWEIATQPLRVPDYLAVDHFAAFPMEWPRRIIAGWSPTGICLACDQPRTPIVQGSGTGSDNNPDREFRNHVGATGQKFYAHRAANPRLLLGYACACPEPTAPTRPAVVLDPFGGTGTTALVAAALGRRGVTVDRSADYCRIAAWRTADPGERARALGLPKPPPQVAGQADLFGEVVA